MQKIMEAVEQVLEFIREIPLSSGTINRYKIHYRSSIVPYCEVNHIDIFTDDAMRCYVVEQVSRAKDGKISHGYVLPQRKAAALLADCMQGRALVWECRDYKKAMLSAYFKKILNDYREHLCKTLAP